MITQLWNFVKTVINVSVSLIGTALDVISSYCKTTKENATTMSERIESVVCEVEETIDHVVIVIDSVASSVGRVITKLCITAIQKIEVLLSSIPAVATELIRVIIPVLLRSFASALV